MATVRYRIDPGMVVAQSGAAYVEDVSDASEVVQDAYSSIAASLEITISGVTAPAAFWLDPGNWEDDWRELAGDRIEGNGVEGVYEFIAGLLAQARED
jgi:hypothetical protein